MLRPVHPNKKVCYRPSEAAEVACFSDTVFHFIIIHLDFSKKLVTHCQESCKPSVLNCCCGCSGLCQTKILTLF